MRDTGLLRVWLAGVRRVSVVFTLYIFGLTYSFFNPQVKLHYIISKLEKSLEAVPLYAPRNIRISVGQKWDGRFTLPGKTSINTLRCLEMNPIHRVYTRMIASDI